MNFFSAVSSLLLCHSSTPDNECFIPACGEAMKKNASRNAVEAALRNAASSQRTRDGKRVERAEEILDQRVSGPDGCKGREQE